MSDAPHAIIYERELIYAFPYRLRAARNRLFCIAEGPPAVLPAGSAVLYGPGTRRYEE